MATLYLMEEGSSLHLKDNRLQIKNTTETLKEISIEKVDNIVLMGKCHITSPLTTELLERLDNNLASGNENLNKT